MIIKAIEQQSITIDLHRQWGEASHLISLIERMILAILTTILTVTVILNLLYHHHYSHHYHTLEKSHMIWQQRVITKILITTHCINNSINNIK